MEALVIVISSYYILAGGGGIGEVKWRTRGVSVGESCCDAKEKGKKIILLMRTHGKKVLQERSKSSNNFC